jgi:subtilisin family serine protease
LFKVCSNYPRADLVPVAPSGGISLFYWCQKPTKFNRETIFLIAGVLVLLFLVPHTVRAASYVQDEILVRFKPQTSPDSIQRLHARLRSVKTVGFPLVGIQRIRIAEDLSVEEAIEQYQQDESVLFAEPNYIRRVFAVTNDPDFNQQWDLLAIDAPQAWDITSPSNNLVVATIDTGVDYTHPDLDDNIWSNQAEIPGDGIDNDANGYTDDIRGWDFVGTQDSSMCPTTCDCAIDDPVGDNDPMDDFGHGTHVAGIVGAEGDNGTGIAGMMWKTRLMPLKIIDRDGCGTVGDEIQAILYAVANGASIINASFGGKGSSQAEREAIAAAGEAGIVFVAAAGNEKSDIDSSPLFPASHDLPNLISVAASDKGDRLAIFSNFGQSTVDVAAPGDCIRSTTPVGSFTIEGEVSCPGEPITASYAYLSGTSMAAPHVSGVVGLLLTQEPNLSPDRIKAIISLTVDLLDPFTGRVMSSGRLNALKALLREPGTGLSGGEGGCGGLWGYLGQDSMPKKTDVGFISILFLPMLLLIFRWWHRRKRMISQNDVTGRHAGGRLAPSGFSVFKTTIHRSVCKRMVWVLIPSGLMLLGSVTTHAQEPGTHAVAAKIGYHLYPGSEYFDTNAGFFDKKDFAGASVELDYGYRWLDRASLSLALGYYNGQSDTDTICCAEVTFTTLYFLITPRYHFMRPGWGILRPDSVIGDLPLDTYVGAGIGTYYFQLKQSGIITDTVSAVPIGFHILFGLDWTLTRHFSAVTEFRYALAMVKSANPLDDSLNIGGLNVSIGIAYQFSPTGSLSW